MVIVNSIPNISAGNNTSVCLNGSCVTINLIATPPGGTWTTLNGGSVTGNTFTACNTGNYQIKYCYTNPQGCTSCDTLTIEVQVFEQVEAGNNFSICINHGDTLLLGNPPGGTWNGPGIQNNSFYPNISGAGVFTLYYVRGSGTCESKDSLEVTVNPAPDLSVNSPTICSGYCAILNAQVVAGNVTYSWSVPPPNTSQTILVCPNNTTDYSVTVTNSSTGCTSSAASTVTVNPTPSAAFNLDTLACIGQNISLSAPSNLPNTNCSWYIDSNFFSASCTTSHNFTTTGIHTVQLIVKLGNCQDTVTKSIEIIAPPVPSFTTSLSPANGCAPNTVTFYSLSTGSYTDYIFWGFGNGNISTLENPPPQIYQQGLYDTIYTITLSRGNMCDTQSVSNTITIHPWPVVDFGMLKTSVCAWEIDTFYFNVSGNPDYVIVNYGDGSLPDTITNYINFYTHGFPYNGNGTDYTLYTITAIGYNMCGTDTMQKKIKVFPDTIKAFFAPNDTIVCAADTIFFINNSTSGCTSYHWDFGDPGSGSLDTSNQKNPFHKYNAAGTYIVMLAVEHPCGQDTLYKSVVVFPKPVAQFTHSDVCENETVSFLNNTQGVNNYYWDFGDGGTSVLPSPYHLYADTGTYTVTLIAENSIYSCSDTYSDQVTVYYTPQALFTATPLDSCSGFTVVFDNQSTYSNTTGYYWIYDGDTLTYNTIPNPPLYINTNIIDHISTDTTYITLTAFNLLYPACSTSYTLPIYEHPIPLSEFNSINNIMCTFDPPVSIQFFQQSIGGNFYLWIVNGQDSITGENMSYQFSNASSNLIKLITTNSHNCKDSIEKEFRVYGDWENGIELFPPYGCDALPVSFSTLVDSLTYRWTFGDNTPVFTQPDGQDYFTHTYAGAGIYSVYVHVTGIGNCIDSITYTDTITVSHTARANFNFENILLPPPNDGTVNFTNTSGFADYFEWNFGDGSTYTGVDTSHRYWYNGCFDVNLYANNTYMFSDTVYHCPHDTTKKVCVDFFYGLYLPNAVCPSCVGDEINQFIPKAVGLKIFHLQIYDKWNNLVWETRSLDEHGVPNEFFKGYALDGTELPLGAYKWVVVDAMFENGKSWDGMSYKENGKLKRFGNLLIIKK